jgi:hypothetical protein
MSNTRPIQPIPVWIPSGQADATFLGLTNFSDYHFDGGGGVVSYVLIGIKDNGSTTLEDGTVVQNPPSAVDLYNGKLSVPSSVVQSWGESDEIMFQYVASQLQLTIITEQ